MQLSDRGKGLLSGGRPPVPVAPATPPPAASDSTPAAPGQLMARMDRSVVSQGPDGNQSVVSVNGAPVQPDGTLATPMQDAGLMGPAMDQDQPPLPVKIARVRQNTFDQQRAILSEFPGVGLPGSGANQRFIRAFQATGSDPRKALQVARTLFGGG